MRRERILEQLIPIAREAGAAILDVYAAEFSACAKRDASPVTDADERAEELILKALATLTPGVPVVSEEAASHGNLPDVGEQFWLVDPLDGTKEFISRSGEFTVNIALIEDGKAILGIVLAPALDRLFAGAVNLGAFVTHGPQRQPIAVGRYHPKG